MFAAAAIAEAAMDGLANLEGSTFQRATCFPFSCLMAESVKSTEKQKKAYVVVPLVLWSPADDIIYKEQKLRNI